MAARTTGDEVAQRIARQDPEELVGQEVKNTRGDTIAEIVDLVRQISDDQMFVVLSVGGILGVGDKEVAVPVAEFEMAESDTLVLGDTTESSLETLPPYNHALYQSVVE